MSILITTASSTDSPARKVFSMVVPEMRFLSLERTKAAPFPGLTCRNSTTYGWYSEEREGRICRCGKRRRVEEGMGGHTFVVRGVNLSSLSSPEANDLYSFLGRLEFEYRSRGAPTPSVRVSRCFGGDGQLAHCTPHGPIHF